MIYMRTANNRYCNIDLTKIDFENFLNFFFFGFLWQIFITFLENLIKGEQKLKREFRKLLQIFQKSKRKKREIDKEKKKKKWGN